MAEATHSGGSTQVKPDQAFDTFYSEVKAIETRDSVLTSKQQIDRLLRPGASYFNLNPFEVLQVDSDIPLNEVKKRYRQMSILVHPDKNQDDEERAQKAFEAVNNAYKTLENEEGYKRCQEVIEEAKIRTDDMITKKRKELKKEGKPQVVPEDDQEKKKAAEEEENEKIKRKEQEEWNKNFEESRTGRVDSWRSFTGKGGKTKKNKDKKSKPYLGGFRPPKPKPEQR